MVLLHFLATNKLLKGHRGLGSAWHFSCFFLCGSICSFFHTFLNNLILIHSLYIIKSPQHASFLLVVHFYMQSIFSYCTHSFLNLSLYLLSCLFFKHPFPQCTQCSLLHDDRSKLFNSHFSLLNTYIYYWPTFC